jgi:hypothetical protein
MKERIKNLLESKGFDVRTYEDMRRESKNNSQIEVGIYAKLNDYEKIYIKEKNKTNVLYIR